MNTLKILNLAQALHDANKELEEIVRVNYGSWNELLEAKEKLDNFDLHYDMERISNRYLYAKNRLDVFLIQYNPVKAQFEAIKNALKKELENEN